MEDEAKITEQMMEILMEEVKKVYTEKVLDYGMNRRNYGCMDKPDGYAKVTGPCGDTVEIFLRIRNGKIEDVRYTTDGCVPSHAAVSAATEMAKGKTLQGCLKVNQSSILEYLGGLPDESKHCALLAAITLHKALRNFVVQKKRYGEHGGS
ncbi:MAG: iron-sulfur cluster assembly scaffold protein [Deltaproteobacteria bacterium]|nr:iron-sulfur cluster assembly scaffold protein [Deltaproteobacteria bacterium]